MYILLTSWSHEKMYILLKTDVYNLQLGEIVHHRATGFETRDLKWANTQFCVQNPGDMTCGIEIWPLQCCCTTMLLSEDLIDWSCPSPPLPG